MSERVVSDEQVAEIEQAHYAVEWQRCDEDGTPNPADPLPPFCAACTDEEYVGAIEFGDTIDESAGVVSWPCETLKLARELRDAPAEVESQRQGNAGLVVMYDRDMARASDTIDELSAELAAERAKVEKVEHLLLTQFYGYDTRELGRTYHADAVDELLTDLRAALAGGDENE